MKLLLDSANFDEIAVALSTDAIVGVTTNPSLMAKEEHGDYVENLLQIARLVRHGRHLSIEVLSTGPDAVFDEACELHSRLGEASPSANIHVKVPISFENLSVITRLKNHGVRVNATACMTYSQAKLASDAGADVVSFFWNRMKDGGIENPEYEVVDFCKMTVPRAKIICGSIRKPDDVYDCWEAGADYVTAGMTIIRGLTIHPETDKAVARFMDDISEWRRT